MEELRMVSPSDTALQTLIPPRDRLAFVRIERMLERGRPLVLTDGQSCLLVLGEPKTPAWIWTANDISEEMLHSLFDSLATLRSTGQLSGIIAKGTVARLAELAWSSIPAERQRMSVYRMDRLRVCTAEGEFVPGSEVVSVRAGELLDRLSFADGNPMTAAQRREAGEAFGKDAFAAGWRAPDGTVASIARRADVGSGYSVIHSVVTDAPYRNRGYAKARLSVLCERILQENRIPMLYADRDYAPSNAAYRGVGFEERAHLCAIRWKDS